MVIVNKGVLNVVDPEKICIFHKIDNDQACHKRKEELPVIAEMIKAVGAKNCIIGTDLGNTKLCYPDEGMEEFAEALVAEGLTGEDIRAMAVTNPRWLLGKE